MNIERVSWPGYISLEMPAGWSHFTEDGIISLFDAEQGCGVLQISFARRSGTGPPGEDEPVDLIEHFALQRMWNLPEGSVRRTRLASSLAAVLTHRDADGVLWEVWQIVGSQRAMLATYNCDEADEQAEQAERTAIIESIRWEPAL